MMPKGGYRASSGRPPKASSTKANPAREAIQDQQAAPATVAEALDPLAYMLRVMNDVSAKPERRDRMAIAAAPFMHPRATDVAKGKKELQAERAKAAASGRFTPRPPPKLVA